MHKRLLVCSLWISVAAFAAEKPKPAFARKPVATKAGDKVNIAFAADRETDVAVFIEDGNGKVVRHLVAGVLGKNAPAPLKPGLAQSIEWDGRADYGKPLPSAASGGGGFKVRVALGLGAKFDKIVAKDSQNFGSILCMGTGPDGTLYVSSWVGAPVPNWQTDTIIAIDRAGMYKRTVMPFPANIEKSKLGSLQTLDIDGRLSPLVHKIARRSFYPGASGASCMAVTRDGVVLRLVGGYYGAPGNYLTAVGCDAGLPWDYLGSNLKLRTDRAGGKGPYLCLSGDGNSLYAHGLAESAAVYRIAIPARKQAEVFFGDPKAKGEDQTHVGGATGGMATDGKGNLLIADPANDRVVVVAEKDGSFVGSFPVKQPMALAVDQPTGQVYLTRRLGRESSELVKLSGWKDPKELAVLVLKGGGNKIALDSGVKPPILWVASGGLLRVQEAGGKLVPVKVSSGNFSRAAFEDISVDRFRPDQEVYVRTDRSLWMRFNESTGEFTAIRPKGPGNGGKGLCIMPGPDGNIYGPEWPSNLYKWDRNGKEIAWESPEKMAPDFNRKAVHKTVPNGTFIPVCMTFMSHTLGIRHDNHPFVFARLPSNSFRSPKALYEFLPSGKRVEEPIIWKVSDVAVGPKFDQQGNIYIAEAVKPQDKLVPGEFEAVIAAGPKGAEREGTPAGAAMTMYGSIIKFSPKGGIISYDDKKVQHAHATREDPYKGTPKLDPSLKSEKVSYYKGDKFQSLSHTAVVGAEWIRMGISHIEIFYCNCESTRFDVDEFGRVWYPDLGRFRVVCLDTNGNEIMHFGAYGNADDPMGDAEPEARFAWLIGVGVTEKYAYMGDSINRRMLRCKKVYAAEEVCPVQ